jgi:hypothetical protein
MNRTALAAIAAAAFTLLGAHGAQAQTAIGGGKNAPTFPISINQSGHYKLAASLVVPAGQTAIQVGASNVILDLNGFTISSATPVCTGEWPALNCASGFYTAGVRNTGNYVNITVRNGSITGFSHGIHLYQRSLIEDVVLENNAVYGAMVASGSVLRGVRTANNKAGGIYAQQSVVKDSSASGSNVAFWGEGNLVQNVVSYDTNFAILSNGGAAGTTGVRESVFKTSGNMFQGAVQSLGNNLCNGSPC